MTQFLFVEIIKYKTQEAKSVAAILLL